MLLVELINPNDRCLLGSRWLSMYRTIIGENVNTARQRSETSVIDRAMFILFEARTRLLFAAGCAERRERSRYAKETKF